MLIPIVGFLKGQIFLALGHVMSIAPSREISSSDFFPSCLTRIGLHVARHLAESGSCSCKEWCPFRNLPLWVSLKRI